MKMVVSEMDGGKKTLDMANIIPWNTAARTG